MTSQLRPYDSGIMELGLEYTNKMAIPPHQEMFPLKGYCIEECTAVVSTARSDLPVCLFCPFYSKKRAFYILILVNGTLLFSAMVLDEQNFLNCKINMFLIYPQKHIERPHNVLIPLLSRAM